MTTPTPTPAQWQQVRALFDEVMALLPEQRHEYLLAVTADAAVRAEVESLLAHADAAQAEDAMAPAFGPAGSGHGVEGAAGGPALEGQRVGPWTLVGPLGQGGMGEVLRARRSDGAYDGEAAIKILKRGMDSAALLARFAQEQRALARLNHPHIARLFDAGLTADQRPYFVMELVEGQPIDRAVQGLSLEQRLGLFLQLADAVAYAHRQLLVHRDLKPGNVLVDGRGQVKLLDFGIAKALEAQDGDAATTHQGQRPFTPHYASPEQVRGEPVGTGTDIYSLGVLLYQLLTGLRPYGRDATTPQAAARSVLEDTPTKPSALSPGLVADPQWLATRRKLKGDLDNILLKALEKPVERRYASVDALAADVRAYLGGYPVSARAARPGYLLAKFVARNRVAVGAAALAVLALVAGAGVATWQSLVARSQREIAERRFDEVRRFARTMLFNVDTALRDGPTAGRQKLVQTSLEYLDRLSAERLDDAALLRDVAEAYERIGDIQGNTMQSNLGRPQDAQASFDKALALRESLARMAPADLDNVNGLLKAHERLGDNARSQGRLTQAALHYAQAAQQAGVLARARPDDLKLRLRRIEAERYLASIHYWPFNPSLGDYAKARPVIEALNSEMSTLLAQHPNQAEVLEAASGLVNQHADFQRLAGEYAATVVTLRKSVALAQQLLAQAPANPRWQRWLYLAEGRLGDALIETGDTEAGIALWRQSIERREAVARQDPENERAQRNVVNGYGPLAEQLDVLGRTADALHWYGSENRLLRQLRGKYPQVTVLATRLDDSDRDLALQLVLNGRAGEGRQVMRELLKRRAASAPETQEVDHQAQARLAVLSARVLLSAPVPATERAELIGTAETAIERLAVAAQREPFNAWLAREVAVSAWGLAVALRPVNPQAACQWLKRALTGFEALQVRQRLSAPHQALLLRERAQLLRCGAGG